MDKSVRIVVPSGKIDLSLVDAAKTRLEEWGYLVDLGAHAREAVGRFGGTQANRLADLNAAFLDENVRFVLCARGGYGLVQILDKIHKPTNGATVIGFSDVTALHLLFGTWDIPSLHAVMAKHLAEYESHRESCDALRAALDGAPLQYHLEPHPLNRLGKTQGTLRGGNLSVLYGLQGTPYALRTDTPTILFIEDVGEHPYAIDRMMNNLRLSGVLERIHGLVVGQFSDYEEDPLMGGTVCERIREMVEPYNYPVIFNFPAGHVARNLPLWMNAPCSLSVNTDTATFVQD